MTKKLKYVLHLLPRKLKSVIPSFLHFFEMNSLAKKHKTFNVSIDIDRALTSEGRESERSLIEDGDEFSDNFAGALSFSDEAAGGIFSGIPRDPSTHSLGIMFEVDGKGDGEPTRVSFEIISAKIVKEKSKYVVYTISIRSPAHLDNSPACLEKRYSEFEHFNNILRKKYPLLMQDIAFPKKMITGNFKAETIAQRSRAFEQYLAHIFSIPAIRLSHEFAEFCFGKYLHTGYNLLLTRHFNNALTPLKNAFLLEKKLLGEKHELLVATLCAIVCCCKKMERDEQAQMYADMALQILLERETSVFLVPLLILCIRLCWQLGKDKQDLEARLHRLRESGLLEREAPSLLDVVLSNLKQFSS